MISFICFLIAAKHNAVMDVLTHHFEDSIYFIEGDIENRQWYDPSVSWKNKYIGHNPENGRLKLFLFNSEKYENKFIKYLVKQLNKINYPVQFTDDWHLNKTFMIIFLALSVVTFPGVNNMFEFLNYFIGFGIGWNIMFSLFYNKLLRK